MTHPGAGRGYALHLLSTHCLSPHPRPLSLNAALAGSLGRGGGVLAGSGCAPLLVPALTPRGGWLGAVLYICTNSGDEKPLPRLTGRETEAGRQRNGRPRSHASQGTRMPGR